MPHEKNIEHIVPILQQLTNTLSEMDAHPAVVRKVYHSLARLHEQLEDFDMALYYYKAYAYFDEGAFQNISHKVREAAPIKTEEEEPVADLTGAPATEGVTISAIVEIQEHERKEIARDIYDDMAQILSSVKMQLSTFLTPGKNETLSVQQLIDLLNNVFHDIRSIRDWLSPLELENLGLGSVLEELCRHSSTGNIHIKFYTNINKLHFPQWFELSIYRIAHQLIKNITLHSKATKATVQLIAHENFLVLTVEDNGIGFNIEEVSQKGRGLRNTALRVKILNGKIDIDSTPGQGTCITIEIPFFPFACKYSQ